MTLLYSLFKIPGTLDEFLEKAKSRNIEFYTLTVEGIWRNGYTGLGVLDAELCLNAFPKANNEPVPGVWPAKHNLPRPSPLSFSVASHNSVSDVECLDVLCADGEKVRDYLLSKELPISFNAYQYKDWYFRTKGRRSFLFGEPGRIALIRDEQ